MRKWLKALGSDVIASINPTKYKDLAIRRLGDATLFALTIVLIAFILYSLFMLPALLKAPAQLDSALGEFTTLEIQVAADMRQPVYLLNGRVVVDLNDSLSEVPENAQVYLGSSNIQYLFKKFGLSVLEGSHSWHDLKNITSNRSAIQALFTSVILFLLPGLFVAGYILIVLKMLALLLFVLFCIRVLASVIGFHTTFREQMVIGLFAIPFLALNLLLKPFVTTYFIPHAVYILYCLVGTITAGDFTKKKKKD